MVKKGKNWYCYFATSQNGGKDMAKKPTSIWFMAVLVLGVLISRPAATAQERGSGLPVQYEEMTAPQFAAAVEKSGGTCIIPLGIIEKHGAHLPLGTDLISARETVRLAAEKEYAIVFPAYYFGQIFEARHQPGTLAYSERLIYDVLAETCAELTRNGIKKIILYNGHGGNESFVAYFCQTQLALRKDFAVYLFTPARNIEDDPEIKKLIRSKLDMHGGERETSVMLAINPSLVHLDQAKTDSGEDEHRLAHLSRSYTGIWWYARFPNHYAGDGSLATAELGRLLLKADVDDLAAMIREVKQDKAVLELQKQFYDAAEKPLKPVK
jgi:creatinine amidohydrolase